MNKVTQINESILERFALLKKKNRVAHAYLFIGPADIGKGDTAVAIAKLVNCEDEQKNYFCDQCASCIKINSANHPDLAIIDNEFGEAIKIDQIRDLLSRNRLRPLLATKKVFIINRIEYLTLEAGNAFLKTLEEPSADSLILLTTSVPEKNLDTIKSRCHAIHFQPVSNNGLMVQLKEEYNMTEQNAHFLSYFSQGCPGTARKLNDDGFFERKNDYIDAFIVRRPDENAIKGLLAKKEETKELLNILSSWMRDALLLKVQVNDERLIHLDRIKDLNYFMQRYSFNELNSINKSIIKMHQLLADNLNIKLPLLIIGEQLWEK